MFTLKLREREREREREMKVRVRRCKPGRCPVEGGLGKKSLKKRKLYQIILIKKLNYKKES